MFAKRVMLPIHKIKHIAIFIRYLSKKYRMCYIYSYIMYLFV